MLCGSSLIGDGEKQVQDEWGGNPGSILKGGAGAWMYCIQLIPVLLSYDADSQDGENDQGKPDS